MKGLKIAILYEVYEDDPPPQPRKKTASKRKKRRSEMPDREQIFDALLKLGHEPFYHGLDGRTQTLFAVSKTDADLVFNLVESYGGDDTKDLNIAAYLDLLAMRYTGAGPHALHLAQDKSLAKKIFHFHGIQTPFFASSYRGRIEHAHDIKFPLIVKPASEDGSIGIDNDSVVHSIKELMERIHYVHDQFDCPALIEEYIEGREIYVSILGSYERTEVLPLIELDLSKLPKGTPRIAGQDVKFWRETDAYKLTKSAPVENLSEETADKIRSTALAAYRALKLRDYGRIDLRLRDDGQVFVIEANPNPWLDSSAEFAMAARASGRTYTDLIGEIVSLSMIRGTTPIIATAAATT
jgi:D-alanine-D-alanine ligase